MALSPALSRHLSSAAPVRNFIPDPQILSVICDAARHTSQVPRLRGAPGRPTFRGARKKSAHLCGEMRVRFCLPGLCCLTKRKGRAHKNPPNRFLEARGPTLNAQIPAAGRAAWEPHCLLVGRALWHIFPKIFSKGSGAIAGQLWPGSRRLRPRPPPALGELNREFN